MSDFAVATGSSGNGEEWFGHPRGLYTLFFTEMWERFSYYGMRALLILYLTAAIADGGMGISDATAGAIYGLYVAGVYLAALPGGWIADRILGKQDAVFWGGIIIAAGHFSMALGSTALFFAGLFLIVIGTGLLKPNVSAVVGDLYTDKGARRDAGFSIFYMGINLGAFIGPLICGPLAENVNWHLGFGAAGVGMLLGVIQYKLGTKHLKGAGTLPAGTDTSAAKSQLLKGIVVALALAGGLYMVDRAGAIAITPEGMANVTGGIIVAIALVYFGYLMILGGLDADEKKRVIYIFLLFVGAALFWSGFEQAGSTMNLFAERLTDRTFGGWEMPTSWLQSVNPLWIIILSPIFGIIWNAMRERNPSIPVKFGLGLVLLGIGFFVIAWGASFATEANPVSPMWLVVMYFFHSAGELCLSPMGLSSVTKLSPTRLVGQMMGVWFMGTSLGNLLAGLAAGRLEAMTPVSLFSTVGTMSVGAGLLYLLFKGPIRKLAPDVQ